MKNAVCFLFSLFGYSSFLSAQGIDSTSIKLIDSLIQVSRTFISIDSFEKALEVNVIAEKMALDKFGRESASYGSACFNHGRLLYFEEKYPEAEKWYLESMAIREKVLGKNNLDYAWCLHNLAGLYNNTRDYKKAEQLYIESKNIREKLLGKEHPVYAQSLHNLANLYFDIPDYAKAEQYYLEAIEVRGKALGKAHPDYLYSLNNLAVLYVEMGNFEKAESLYLQAIGIREKALGKQHPDYAASVNDLAVLYDELSNYEKAEPLYLEALNIRVKVLGKEHPQYAWSLNNLGVLYISLGNYEKAEQLLLEAKTIREKILGKEDADYSTSLNNLGALYFNLGNFQKAEPLFLEANSIREKVLGKEHPDYALSLGNLGSLYNKMGNFQKAELLNLEANTIRKKVLGINHPKYARGLINLGLMYMDNGNYEKAEPFINEAKPILEKAIGKESFDYAKCLNVFGNLYLNMGNYQKAESLLIEAKVILEKVVGKDHPYYSQLLNSLVILYKAIGKYNLAESFLKNLAELNQILIKKSIHYLSERELNAYVNKFSESQDNTLSFAYQSKSIHSGQICYDNCLFFKGFLLNASSQIKRLSFSNNTLKEKFNLLKSYERRLAAEYTKPFADRKGVEWLETSANDLEKDLTKMVAGFGEAIRQVKWYEVQQNLKANEAAIEFVPFKYTDAKTTDSVFYCALVLLHEDSCPQYVTLFEEKELKHLLSKSKVRRIEYVANVYQSSFDQKKIPDSEKFKSLYELIWKPLESRLKGVKTIYFSSGGLLNQINLNAISTNSQEILSDRFTMVQLGSTRQLVVKDPISALSNYSACLIGGVNFDLDSTIMIENHYEQDTNKIAYRGELSFTYTDSSNRQSTWKYLKGSQKEIQEIQGVFKKSGLTPSLYYGNGATEEAFKKIGEYHSDSTGFLSPRIIHISTHGYFFPDPKDSGRRSIVNGQSEPVFRISEHPMIRSGLILAGANNTWKTGKPLRPDMEDGILTAYEISQLNLRNTELIVLSACETGLGDIQGNEGVYGLQRAFKIAGVKNLIMSLWQVPDKETSELMILFYQNWLLKKMSIRESLLAAQNVLRKRGLSAFYWAGFVLVE